jgi:hypothetical protein
MKSPNAGENAENRIRAGFRLLEPFAGDRFAGRGPHALEILPLPSSGPAVHGHVPVATAFPPGGETPHRPADAAVIDSCSWSSFVARSTYDSLSAVSGAFRNGIAALAV